MYDIYSMIRSDTTLRRIFALSGKRVLVFRFSTVLSIASVRRCDRRVIEYTVLFYCEAV